MGGWKLEVFKMGVYMTFPVVLFYYFNQPEFFESWMLEKRDTLFPPQEPNVCLELEESSKLKERINKTIDYLEKRREEQLTKQRAP